MEKTEKIKGTTPGVTLEKEELDAIYCTSKIVDI